MPKPAVTLSDLHGDPQNARRHNSRNIEQVQASLQAYGAARSIVIDEDNQIIAGHGVVEAAVRAGIERVQVVDGDGETIIAVRRSGLTRKQKQGLGIADNRASELAEWDADVLAGLKDEIDLGQFWQKDELDQLLRSVGGSDVDAEPQVDRGAELQAKWQTAAGDLWEAGPHRILCGDSTNADDVWRLLDGVEADCVFTSPPYAVGVEYDNYQDTIDNLRAMLPKLSRLWLDVVTDGGFAVVNFGDIASGRNVAGSTDPCEYPMALEYWPVFRADGWLLWSRRVWCKPNPRVHSPWCIQSNRAATDWEHIWTWRKPGAPILKRVDGESGSPNGWKSSESMHGVDIGKDIHGAGMALGIAEWMLNVHSRPGAVVYDPFCGTGTTLIACERIGRVCRAQEISPASTAIALERWAMATSKTPVRVD